MLGVGADGFHRVQVKALHVHEGLEAALVEHLDQIAGDAAQGHAALDLLAEHNVLQELGGGQRSSARAGLEAEAVL